MNGAELLNALTRDPEHEAPKGKRVTLIRHAATVRMTWDPNSKSWDFDKPKVSVYIETEPDPEAS